MEADGWSEMEKGKGRDGMGGGIPNIYNTLEVLLKSGEQFTREVQQHIGDGVVRTIAMSATDGLQHGIALVTEKW
jgi:F0F1-type ATP synthase beta subunit